MAEQVLREDFEGWAVLTLNRPDKLNALTVSMFRELMQHIAELRKDDSIACVVLRGAGKCFSAGHDLADIAEGEAVPSRGWHSETLRMMEKLPKPVIAAVHGHCYTGALEVALAADFILAADTARFGDTHAKWALTPIWGMSQRLPRRVGTRNRQAPDVHRRYDRRRGSCADRACRICRTARRVRCRDRSAGAENSRQFRLFACGQQALA